MAHFSECRDGYAQKVLDTADIVRDGDVSTVIPWNYNSAVVRRAKAEPLLRSFKGFGTLRERGSDANWFPVEFLTYHDDRNKLRSFAYVRREDGVDIPDGHYVFQDELGVTEFQMEKVEGQVAVRMALSRRLTTVSELYRDVTPDSGFHAAARLELSRAG